MLRQCEVWGGKMYTNLRVRTSVLYYTFADRLTLLIRSMQQWQRRRAITVFTPNSFHVLSSQNELAQTHVMPHCILSKSHSHAGRRSEYRSTTFEHHVTAMYQPNVNSAPTITTNNWWSDMHNTYMCVRCNHSLAQVHLIKVKVNVDLYSASSWEPHL